MGMHHWGRRELEVGVVYYCKREPSNPYDRNAVGVFSDITLQSTAGYLRKEDAAALNKVLEFADRNVFLKAKMSAAKFSPRKGPMQLCNIGFKCQDRNIDSVRQLISGYGVQIF